MYSAVKIISLFLHSYRLPPFSLCFCLTYFIIQAKDCAERGSWPPLEMLAASLASALNHIPSEISRAKLEHTIAQGC